MTYRLGIDVGAAHTTWASVAGRADGAVDSGTIESALGITPDGQLVGGPALAGATTVVRDFVPRLGDSAPVMLGTTPYGAEALVARLIATIIDTVRARQGSEPTAVALVHDDGLDPYRTGLLTEAARLAGIAPAAIVLVSRSDAAASGGTSASAATGAAKAGWARVPDPIAPTAGTTALGVAGGAAAAATGVGAAALIADGGTATASAAAPTIAGPAGTPLTPAGPAGTPLQPPAGPSGTPLQPPTAGPGGTPLQPAGPTGTPLQPPASGPAGTPLPGVTPTVPVSTGIGTPKPKIPKWVTIAAGSAAVIAVGVGIAVVASGGDDENATLGGSEVVVEATDANGNTITVPAGGTDTTTGGGSDGEQFDLTPILGTWLQPCQPFIDGTGASQGSMTLTSPGTNQLALVIDGGDAASADCGGGFESAITVTYQLNVTAAGTSAGVTAFVAEQVGDPTCVSIEPAACGLALGTAQSPPTAIGVDGSGQLVVSYESVSGGVLPTTWEVMVEGSTRI